MATGTVAVTPTDSWYDGKRLHVAGTMAISGSGDTYATGGLVASFAGKVLAASIPSFVKIDGIAGYTYRYVPGTSQALGKMMVFIEATVATNTPLAEFGNTNALGAGMAGDTISFYAVFKLR